MAGTDSNASQSDFRPFSIKAKRKFDVPGSKWVDGRVLPIAKKVYGYSPPDKIRVVLQKGLDRDSRKYGYKTGMVASALTDGPILIDWDHYYNSLLETSLSNNLKDTILHEFAHIITNSKEGTHNEKWWKIYLGLCKRLRVKPDILDLLIRFTHSHPGQPLETFFVYLRKLRRSGVRIS